MPRKTKIIFITVFVIVGALMIGLYYYFNSKNKADNVEDNGSFFQTFNPFSNSGGDQTDNTNNDSGDTTGDSSSTPNATSKFTKLTDFAIAGATFFEDVRVIKETATSDTATATTDVTKTETPTATKTVTEKPKEEIVPALRYVERATGHIYQMYLDTKEKGKISNTTIPAVYEAIFDSKASTVIYRYLSESSKTITSFLASLGGAKGEFLSSNITEISLSKDKNKVFYIVEGANGVSGSIRNLNDGKVKQFFSSPFSEWLLQYVTDQKVYLTTKPSWLYKGSVFSVNTSTGVISKLFGGIAGLTTLANVDGNLVLYNASTNSGPELNIFNIKDHTSKNLGLYGLPEKCVWTSDNLFIYCAVPSVISGSEYPDAWYKGTVSFDDYFVVVNVETGGISTVANGNKEVSVDATHLFLDKSEENIYFTNKKDSTLWALRIW